MKITLTPEESENYFYNALCNGLSQLRSYSVTIITLEEKYASARAKLREKGESTCIEDVYMQILRDGNTLTMHDMDESEDDAIITLEDVHERVANTPINNLTDMIKENDDADTADAILQTVFYNQIIFG